MELPRVEGAFRRAMLAAPKAVGAISPSIAERSIHLTLNMMSGVH